MTIDELIDIAIEGGREILRVYATDFAASRKSDATLVTEADLACEAIVARRLRAAMPEVPVVAEEEMAEGHRPAPASRIFLVDPLDGTREFVARNGDFTVNIALVEDGAPVAGVVFAPALGLVWAGSSERGAVRASVANGRISSLAPIAVRPAPDAIVAVVSRSRDGGPTRDWLARVELADVLRRGSSLKFCLVAEGTADLYPCLGRTMEWDTAAGDAVLRAAGGMVATLDGEPLAYDKRGQAMDCDFANPAVIACGDLALLRRTVTAV